MSRGQTRGWCPSTCGRTPRSCEQHQTRHTLPPSCSPSSLQHHPFDSTCQGSSERQPVLSIRYRNSSDLEPQSPGERVAGHRTLHAPCMHTHTHRYHRHHYHCIFSAGQIKNIQPEQWYSTFTEYSNDTVFF